MDDGLRKITIQDQFQASIPAVESRYIRTPSSSRPSIEDSPRLSGREFRSSTSMLKLFSIRGLTWGSGSEGEEKVELTSVELASLRSQLADLEEREAHLKARLEHIDEILRSARLSGYLHIRTRWEALPGEPLPIDDSEVDDWIPRFVVLHGSCFYFYLLSTDLSPQDSTLLSDVVEIFHLPSYTAENGELRYSFCILTCHGLRYECSSVSKVQVDNWVIALASPRDNPKFCP